MPSPEHEALVDLFRTHPSLAVHLVEAALHIPLPAYSSITIVEASLDQLASIEFRADLVIELKDESDNLLLAIVLEVQLRSDADKRYSWPVYATVTRSRKRCPACVLVIAPDADVAVWAATPIEIGPGSGPWTPLVLGPNEVPRVTDPEVARSEPALSVLSALAHGNEPTEGLSVLMAALVGLTGFDLSTAQVYLLVIYKALSEPIRQALEAKIMELKALGEVELPPFAQQLVDDGKIQGRREGIREGEARGQRAGRREVLLRLAARYGLVLTDEQRVRIEACEDLATLDRWFDNAFTAKTPDELFH